MEEESVKRKGEEDRQRRMGEEEIEDSGFTFEEDELDWSEITDQTDFKLNEEIDEEISPGGSQAEEDSDFEVDSGSVEDEGSERGAGLSACLWPVEESGGHFRIPLDEVERYYRFSRCCHWLCGT